MSDEPSWNGAAPPGAVLPAPEPATVEGFLRAARDVHASDLHLSAGSVPWARVEGEAVRFDVDELAPEAAEALTADLLRRGGAERTLDGDFCFDSPGLGRFRANVHRQRRGWGASLKCIPLEILGLEELGLPEELYELTQYRVGLVLITGPTNSGKSSTLAALLDQIGRAHV